MNVLIAHDGSEYSDAILKDLQFAGLPAHSSIIALSVIGASFEEHRPSLLTGNTSQTVAVRAQTEVHYVKTILKQHFPDWYVEAEVLQGNATDEILRVAEERNVDLIVMGSHRRNGIHRLLMGSVSSSVASRVSCDVRIVHPRHRHLEQPLNILVCLDGSSTAAESINSILGRSFPRNTRIHLLHVIDGKLLFEQLPMLAIQNFLDDSLPVDLRRVHAMLDYYRAEVKQRYHCIETQIRYGDPAAEILHYAHLEEIDSIFIGAQGHSAIDRIVFGSVSSTVMQRADTTVEIVRR